MLKPDFDTTMRNIVATLRMVKERGLTPHKLYMSNRTYISLIGIFERAPIVMIPEGIHRTPTIYGVKIGISDDLADNDIDVSVRLD